MLAVYIAIIILLIYSSIIDLKQKESPDWVFFLIFFIGLFLNTYNSFITRNYSLLLNMLISIIISLIIGAILIYTKAWGMGDAKILIALSTIIPFSKEIFFNGFIFFLLLSIFTGSIYGLIYLYFLLIVKRNPYRYKYLVILFLLLIGLILLFLYYLYLNLYLFLIAVIILFLALFLFSLLSKKIEKDLFITPKPLNKVVEGDWVYRDVRIKGKIFLRKGDLINSKHLKALKRRHFRGKIYVKEGIPFIPSFLLAFILYLLLVKP